MPLAQLFASFQSPPPVPTNKLGPSGADSWVSGFVYILGHCGSVQWTLLWGWEFFPPLQPSRIFTVTGFEASFPHAGILGSVVYLTPQLFLPVYPHAKVGTPALLAVTSPTAPATAFLWVLSALAACLCPSYHSGWFFFFNSLVVRLTYSSTFWQFWLFFVFKFVVVLLLVVWGGKVYVPMPQSWPDVPHILFFNT